MRARELVFAIVGLGNPGAEYSRTRHNAGFWVVEQIVSRPGKFQTPWPKEFSSHRWKEKFGGRFLKTKLESEEILLILPQSYMNRSGEVLVPLLHFFRISPTDLVVIHDELDLDPGALRVRRGGRSGGHNGVESIITQLGSDDFLRIRIGIGHPRRVGSSADPSDWVLSDPASEEIAPLAMAVERACACVQVLISGGLELAQREFNGG